MKSNNERQKKVYNALKDQQEIFGDELFERFQLKPMTEKKVEKMTDSFTENNELPFEEFQKAKSLDQLYNMICECQKCPLGKTRNKFVFGSGSPEANVMVVGEGPGAEEDLQGLPFVGRAGQLLTDILKAINFSREEVFIANIVKCRPPQNRNPLPQEMEECLPYLSKQIALIKPKLILCLGLVAAQALLKQKNSLGSLRGKVFELGNIKVMVTYHPAALLRNPKWKRGCWEDVQQFRKLYDELV